MNFNISGEIKTLPSERDQNFLISGNTSYVCKISRSEDTLSSIEFQNAALLHLEAKRQAGIPRLVKNISGGYISYIEDGNSKFMLRMLTYLPGKVIAKYRPHDSSLLTTFGTYLGTLSNNLQDFTFESPTSDFYWSLKSGKSIISDYQKYITNPDQKYLLEKYDARFDEFLFPFWTDLRECIVHNDSNDYNVLVNKDREIGLIDFGDMVQSFAVSELVIGLTYILLEKKDPISVFHQMVRGYVSVSNLTDLEMKLLFPLICLRLCQSVSISTYQSSLEPDNDYLLISQKPAWEALKLFITIHPNLVYYVIRDAAGLDPHPNSKTIVQKFTSLSFHKIIEMQPELLLLDQAIDSRDLAFLSLDEEDPTARFILDTSRNNPDKTLIGRYDEIRLVYLQDSFKAPSEEIQEYRCVHLGIDIFALPGTPVQSPMDGEVYAVDKHPAKYDWGTYVCIKHTLDDLSFFTIYGHLSCDSVKHLVVGNQIKAGDYIGCVGNMSENGGWNPHLHFQIVIDVLNLPHNFPGVASYTQRNIYLSLCPDPQSIIGIESRKSHPYELLEKRQSLLAPSLSLSYNMPLTIVRGHLQYLYDMNGKRYLDAVNNVPHVGHSHPQVVKALSRQAGILNTNTRYLHPSIIQYAEKLLSYFPEPLEVCIFVNSGSEANELALRMAKTYTKQKDVFVLDHAYHGNTSGLIAISPYKFNGPGGSGKSDFVHIISLPDPYRPKYPTVDDYIEEIKNQLQSINPRKPAVFIAEPISGVGGQIILEPQFLRLAFEEIRKHGGLTIADEVQTGFGRVGSHFWSFQLHGVIPDIVTLGKPMGNGHPIGAVITTREIADAFANGMEFFSTFGGNPVSCEVGNSVLKVIETEKLQENAAHVGTSLLDLLISMKDKFPIIGDVRGVGLFIGIELVLDEQKTPALDQSAYIVNRMKDHGILLSVDGPFHNVIKIKPPLCFSQENARFLSDTLQTVLNEDDAQI